MRLTQDVSPINLNKILKIEYMKRPNHRFARYSSITPENWYNIVWEISRGRHFKRCNKIHCRFGNSISIPMLPSLSFFLMISRQLKSNYLRTFVPQRYYRETPFFRYTIDRFYYYQQIKCQCLFYFVARENKRYLLYPDVLGFS